MRPMQVLLRADAGENQGTGHVMRCLTLGEELLSRGHSVALMGSLGSVQWLTDAVNSSGIRHIPCVVDELNLEELTRLQLDWVVIDSYRIPAEQVSDLNRSTPCLAIVDGDARGISADLYLDQNLGTDLDSSRLQGRLLSGSSYVLIRDAVLAHRRRSDSALFVGRPRVVAFMGGTDPNGAIVAVAESIVAEQLDIELDLLVSNSWADRVRAVVPELPHVRLIEPTKDLPAILGRADVVVSAAGTSAWDICTMAHPSVLIALVDNQRDSLEPLRDAQLALTIDATPHGVGDISRAGPLVTSLIDNLELRRKLVHQCREIFDGQGKARVADTMERMLSP